MLDALGAGGSDALVNGERLLQVGGAFTGVAVLEVAVPDSFQRACFLQGGADLTGDGQRLAVVFAGLLAGRGPGRQLTKAVERFGLFVPLAEVAVQPQGLLVAGRGGRVVAGQLLYEAELIECARLARALTEVAPLLQCLLVAGGGGRVVAGQPLQHPELAAGPGLLVAVAEVTMECLGLLQLAAAAG